MKRFHVLVLMLIAGCASHSTLTNSPTADDVLRRADEDTDQIASTLSAIDQAIAITAKNISNAETIGYKRLRTHVTNGHVELLREFEQGAMENTGRQLDIAIQGNGFFCIELPSAYKDRRGYIRNGALIQNADGDLMVAIDDGYRILPLINIPNGVTDVSIGLDGTINYKRSGSTVLTTAGRFQLVQFVNLNGLVETRTGVFEATDQSGMPVMCNPGEDGAGKTLQGFLEGSNVDRVKEQVRLTYLTRWKEDLIDVAKRISPSSLLLPHEAR